MERVLEKQLNRYVLGAIEDDKCYFLRVEHTPVKGRLVADKTYICTYDIEQATKATNRTIAQMFLDSYRENVGDNALDFVILPLEISFSLIKEISE